MPRNSMNTQVPRGGHTTARGRQPDCEVTEILICQSDALIERKTVMASAETKEAWMALDAEVNEYPCARKFQAIGADDGDFVESVRGVISNALGGRHIHPECVTSRPSSKGKYVSAHVTAEMRSGDEVLAVYAALKADERVLWYL